MQAYYASLGQRTIDYPKWIEKLTARAAIEKYKPEVVVGSWVTQLYKGDDPKVGASVLGIDEEAILDAGITYVVIGNQNVHGDKRIMTVPHQEFAFPFLRSRARYPEQDRIWIWNG